MKNVYIYFTDEEYTTLRLSDEIADKLKKKIQKDGFSQTVITADNNLINCSLVREIDFIETE